MDNMRLNQEEADVFKLASTVTDKTSHTRNVFYHKCWSRVLYKLKYSFFNQRKATKQLEAELQQTSACPGAPPKNVTTTQS